MRLSRYLMILGLVVFASAFVASPGYASTPDGETPAEETVCDLESGAAFGLCNAYCEAMDCELRDDGDPDTHPQASEQACLRVKDNYIRVTGKPFLPCEAPFCENPEECSENADCCPGFTCNSDFICVE